MTPWFANFAVTNAADCNLAITFVAVVRQSSTVYGLVGLNTVLENVHDITVSMPSLNIGLARG